MDLLHTLPMLDAFLTCSQMRDIFFVALRLLSQLFLISSLLMNKQYQYLKTNKRQQEKQTQLTKTPSLPAKYHCQSRLSALTCPFIKPQIILRLPLLLLQCVHSLSAILKPVVSASRSISTGASSIGICLWTRCRYGLRYSSNHLRARGRFGFNLGNGYKVHGLVSQYPSEVPPVSQREVYNTRTREIQPVMVTSAGGL